MIEPGRQRQFHIHHCLGRGGYGEVYRATMVSPGGLRTDVAVKLLRVDVDPGAEAVRRLRDEGRMLAALRHPAILRVFDLALLEGRVGLVTEFVEGQDLSTLGAEIPPRALLEVVALVAEALDVAWSHVAENGQPLRLVHRDVKPSNVRVGRHGEVKLLDFGIARSTTEEVDREARTGTGSTVGSLAYMAPERFTRAPITPAADVFGLGCTLYEGLTGRRVFEDAVPVEMFRLASDPAACSAHVEERLGALPPDTHPELVDLLRRMLAHAAPQRPSAAEVRSACEALDPHVPGAPLRRWVREREWPRMALVQGFLDGRTLTEGTLTGQERDGPRTLPPEDPRSSETFRVELPEAWTTDTQPASARPSDARSRRFLFVGALLVALLALGGTAATALWPTHPPPKPTPRPVVVAPAPAPAPIVTPAPDPPSVVVAAESPKPSPRPRQQPRPVAPAPAPEPEPVAVAPEPEPPRFGQVANRDPKVRIELRNAAGAFASGRVPVGRYELHADFGRGLVPVGRVVDVLEDHVSTVECNALRYTCNVD